MRASAVIAIRGRIWDAEQKGMKKITAWGWAAALVALVGCCVSFVTVADDHRAEETDGQRQESLQSVVSKIRVAELLVQFHPRWPTGVELTVANEGLEIVVVSNLTLHWDYAECECLRKPSSGAESIPYSYAVEISASEGSVLIDKKEFKNSAGDIDKFLIELLLPKQKGRYTSWVTFDVTRLKDGQRSRVQTPPVTHDNCIVGRQGILYDLFHSQ